MSDPYEKARRRREIQRGLMVDLMDMQSEADAFEESMKKRFAAWTARRLSASLGLDNEMDREPTP